MNKPAICAAVCACAFSAAALADHDNAQSILGTWKRVESNRYTLQPAKSVRPLEAAPAGTLSEDLTKEAKAFLDERLALILVHKGKIVFEGYASGADRDSKLRAYSMAKSLTSLAVGEALCAGKLTSLDDKAGSVATVLGDTAYAKSSLRNLLKMASGAQDPGGRGYTGIHDMDDFMKVARQEMPMSALFSKYGKAEDPEGARFAYNGLNSEALGHVLAASTGVPLQQWFEQTVWQKAGGEAEFGWYKDSAGQGFAELGVYGTARDFTRIGLYVLDRLNGKPDEACVSGYLQEAVRTQISKDWPGFPGYGFAIHLDDTGYPWFRGHGGQNIGMNPKNGTLLVTHGFALGRGYFDYLLSLWSAFNEWAAKR